MLTENMLWAWNVVFVCNTESIYVRLDLRGWAPLLHITTLTTGYVYVYLQAYHSMTVSGINNSTSTSKHMHIVWSCWSICYRWSWRVRADCLCPYVRNNADVTVSVVRHRFHAKSLLASSGELLTVIKNVNSNNANLMSRCIVVGSV